MDGHFDGTRRRVLMPMTCKPNRPLQDPPYLPMKVRAPS